MTTAQTYYLLVPGWNDSPEGHWQSYWQSTLPGAVRVEQDNWHKPQLQAWVNSLQRNIAALPGAVVLIAHSLGCVTVAHWARHADATMLAKIQGALLVAPADVERKDCPAELINFAPLPQQALPFPSLLVGSSNDHAASAERAQLLARYWGSEAVILPQAGHINVESGHDRWEEGFAYLHRLQQLAEQSRAA